MAIIQCPECGKEISDKASECLGCGYPVQEELKKIYHCPECKREIEEKKDICPHCGYPLNDKSSISMKLSRKHKVLGGVIAIILIITIIASAGIKAWNLSPINQVRKLAEQAAYLYMDEYTAGEDYGELVGDLEYITSYKWYSSGREDTYVDSIYYWYEFYGKTRYGAVRISVSINAMDLYAQNRKSEIVFSDEFSLNNSVYVYETDENFNESKSGFMEYITNEFIEDSDHYEVLDKNTILIVYMDEVQ